jgi:hypothetical protein
VKDPEHLRRLTQLSTEFFHLAAPGTRIFNATASAFVIDAPCPACQYMLGIVPVGCAADCPSKSRHAACTMCASCGTFLFITPPTFEVMTKEDIATLPPEIAMNLYAQRRMLLAR